MLAVAGYLVTFAVAVRRMAALRMFWFDEVFTVYLSRFRSPGELWP